MDIKTNSHTAFCGSKIRNIKLQKLLPKEETVEATVIRFEPASKQDLKTVQAVNEIWENNNFAINIANLLEDLSKGRFRNEGYQVYGITTQTTKLGKLDPNKILCLCEVHSPISKKAKIDYIESKYAYKLNDEKEYKHVGIKMISTLQNIYDQIKLYAERKSLIAYYQKSGFISDTPQKAQHMTWQKPSLTK